MTTSASLQVAGVTDPRLACTGLSWMPTRHARPPLPGMHSTKRGSHVARSSSGVLSRGTNSMSTCWTGQDRPRPAPEPQPEFSGEMHPPHIAEKPTAQTFLAVDTPLPHEPQLPLFSCLPTGWSLSMGSLGYCKRRWGQWWPAKSQPGILRGWGG